MLGISWWLRWSTNCCGCGLAVSWAPEWNDFFILLWADNISLITEPPPRQRGAPAK